MYKRTNTKSELKAGSKDVVRDKLKKNSPPNAYS